MKTLPITSENDPTQKPPDFDQRGILDKLVDVLLDECENANSPVESVGLYSMATMLSLLKQSKIEPKQAVSFLEKFAATKTPAPPQRVEQYSIVDLRNVMSEAVSSNAGILDASIRRAEEARERIKARLNLDDTLALPASEKAVEASESTTETEEKTFLEDAKWRPGEEPVEVTVLRKQAAQSANIQTFESNT